MSNVDNGVQRVMSILGDYTMPEANEIMAKIAEKLTLMANPPITRPPDPDKPETDSEPTTDSAPQSQSQRRRR